MKKIIILTFLFTFLFSVFYFSIADSDQIDIYSPSAILIERSTGKIIYEKNAYEKMYPASTTKIMTAILALENCELTDTAIVSNNAIAVVPMDYAIANLHVGEKVTIYQLLNVLLIASANDAANVLAEHIAGSIDNFCSMMNSKAHELGCLNTNFVNSNGIHNENHYSTAYDLAIIGNYAMNNDTFRSIVSKSGYSYNNRYFSNTNELIVENNNYYYNFATGVKTGYTESAKCCIVASAKKDDLEFICVILGADKTDNGLDSRFLDCKTLFNYAFDNFSIDDFSNKSNLIVGNNVYELNYLDLIYKSILIICIFFILYELIRFKRK